LKKSALSLLALVASSFVAAIFAFFLQVFMARNVEPGEYGLLAASLATVTLISTLSSLGVPSFLIRVFGAEGLTAKRWLAPSYQLITLGVSLGLLVLLLWVCFGGLEDQAQLLTILLVPVIISQPIMELVSMRFQSEGKFYSLSLWQMIPNFFRLFGIVVLLEMLPSVLSVSYFGSVYTIVAVILALLGYMTLRQFPKKSQQLITKDSNSVYIHGECKPGSVLKHSRPFALSGIFYVVYFQSDVILLNFMSGSESAGHYNVAFTIMAAVYLLPNTIYRKFLLPYLYRWVHHAPDRIIDVYRSGSLIMGVLGVSVMVCLLVCIPEVLPKLFGDSYRQTIPILNILAFCIPLRFISSTIASILASEANIKRKTVAMGYTALANIMLNIALIPQLQVQGAAMATLISELLLLALLYNCARKYVFHIPK
jgi:O-antigen/teichoic acid export membrane protein